MKADRENADPMNNFNAAGSGSYCNDPEAINYNYDFPGNANNNVCVYPTDPFRGTYVLMDTVYTADYASFYTVRDTIEVSATDKVKMYMTGLCNGGQSLLMTAGRYYKASLDTTVGIGQPLCAPKDTINGTVAVDSLGDLNLRLTLFSDTAGLKFHVGKAKKI